MTDKIEEIRKRHESVSGNLPIVALAQAETDRATLLAEIARLRSQVLTLEATGAEAADVIDRLMRDSDVARAEIRRQVWHIGLLQEKIDAEKSCACSYDNPDDVCMKHSPQLVAARAEVERLHKEHEAACLGGELLRAEIELLRRSIHD